MASGAWQDMLASDYVIYSSPMRRCLQTARAIRSSGCVQNDIRVMHNLYETGGCYESLDNGDTMGVSGTCESDILQEYPGFQCEDGTTR